MTTDSIATEPALTARMGERAFAVEMDTDGGFTFRADEPESVGGANTGPDPFSHLYASIASCILITVRMYAQRKQWPLEDATIRVYPGRREAYVLKDLEYDLELSGSLTADQWARLQEVAHRCPVHRSVEAGVQIRARGEP